MARMKVEVTALRTEKKGLSVHDRLVAYLPDYAPVAARFSGLANLLQAARRHIPVLSSVLESVTGFTARRDLPKWSAYPFRDSEASHTQTANAQRPVILFADTFNRYFEPENLRSADECLKLLAISYLFRKLKTKNLSVVAERTCQLG